MDDSIAAQALRDSEELHRITLLSMSDAVFLTNDDGLFTFICPNVDVIFGYSHAEVSAMARLSRLFGREIIEPGQLDVSGERRNIELEIETKDGTRRILLVHVKRVSCKHGTLLYACRDITERKQSELASQRNAERLMLALQAANMGMWDWQLATGAMDWSNEMHRLLGDMTGTCSPSFDSFLERVHPVDRDRVTLTISEATNRATPYELEFRVMGYDGVERWLMGKGKALKEEQPPRMLGVFVDCSQRHHAEDELRELGGRLITAHEQERMRLARELHDDLGQRVALVSAGLNMLRQRIGNSAQPVQDGAAALATEISDIGSALHRVSHELHPAKLELLGLDASIRSFCRALAATHAIAVDIEMTEVPGTLSAEAALCLYRITQEALQNVAKHSGATQSTVTLSRGRDDITLSVVDDGVGFDPQTVRSKGTLGLISMQERARLVRGELRISSAPGEGTRVEVHLPFASGPVT